MCRFRYLLFLTVVPLLGCNDNKAQTPKELAPLPKERPGVMSAGAPKGVVTVTPK